jgi:hypothetical protein
MSSPSSRISRTRMYPFVEADQAFNHPIILDRVIRELWLNRVLSSAVRIRHDGLLLCR